MSPYQKMSSAYSGLTFDRETKHHYDLVKLISQKKRSSSFGLKRRFIPIYLCIIFSSLAISLSLFGFIKDYCFKNAVNKKLEVACIPCAYLLKTQFREDDPDVEIIIKEGEKTCCARTPARMQQMINEAFNKRITQLDDKGDQQKQINPWIKNNPLSVLKGAEVNNTRLSITEAGFYYIYSQVYFKIFVGNGTKLPGVLSHQVFRYSVNVPNDGIEKLLQTAHTTTEDKNRDVYFHSNYVEGGFKLDVGDELFVTISHPLLIIRDPNLTVFGVMKLNG